MMEFDNLITLIKTVSSSELTEFSMNNGEMNIFMEKKERETILTDSQGSIALSSDQTGKENKSSLENSDREKEISGNKVKAPLVGTFYSASAPDEESFIKVGDTVKKGQTLGIIEAMKLMNEIESEYDGVVESILVENGQMVEYGQTLFIIK